MEGSHAPYKDQIDDETVLFDLENSMDTMPDTPTSKACDGDSDTQKTQTNHSKNSTSNNTSRRTGSSFSRVGSLSCFTDAMSLEDIYEYDWADSDSESPGDKKSKESYIVQEVLSEYLQIKSFKRKYPDLSRRTMDAYERSWLIQEGMVPSGRTDLGLTALRTDEVMKLLQQEYPEVHVALTDLFRRRRFQAAAAQQKRQYEAARIERGGARAEAARRRAMDSAADYNHQLVSERINNRRCYWDLQTMQIHLPQRTYKLLESVTYPSGAYPVAVIPGQFSEYFVSYTPEQLSHLPLSRVLYPQPIRKLKIPPPLPTNLRFGSFKSYLSNLESSAHDSIDANLSNQASVNQSDIKCNDIVSSQSYPWSCMECHQPGGEDQMLYCDHCNRGYHTYCVGAQQVTDRRWECHLCTLKPNGDIAPNYFHNGMHQRRYRAKLNRPRTYVKRQLNGMKEFGANDDHIITDGGDINKINRILSRPPPRSNDPNRPKRPRGRPPTKNRLSRAVTFMSPPNRPMLYNPVHSFHVPYRPTIPTSGMLIGSHSTGHLIGELHSEQSSSHSLLIPDGSGSNINTTTSTNTNIHLLSDMSQNFKQ